MKPRYATDPILAPGTVARQATRALWEGCEVVSIASPPGAGKTEVITSIAPCLAIDASRRVEIATPTINGAYDLAERLAAKAGSQCPVTLAGGSFAQSRARGGVRVGKPDGRGIVVRTIAGAAYSHNDCDIMMIDEAYQATSLHVRDAIAHASQVMMVGDPGQIGPVVTLDTSLWETSSDNPSARAPEVWETWPGALRLHLPSTFRLGPNTTACIAPLYDFPFSSRRPDAGVDGCPEIRVLSVGQPSTTADRPTMRAIVEYAAQFVGLTYTYNGVARPLATADIAIVATRNEQVATLSSMVAMNPDRKGLTVGTADALQGGQWPVVVAVDPLMGASNVSDHALTPGRLCVMLSRHIGHLSFVTATNVIPLLRQADISRSDKKLQALIRQNLAAYGC